MVQGRNHLQELQASTNQSNKRRLTNGFAAQLRAAIVGCVGSNVRSDVRHHVASSAATRSSLTGSQRWHTFDVRNARVQHTEGVCGRQHSVVHASSSSDDGSSRRPASRLQQPVS